MYIKQTHSTSTLLREQYTDDLPHLYTIHTDFQTAGRGQAGNSWESEEGKNLLFSSLLRYEGVYAADQWRLSMLVAVACWEVLAKYLPKDWLTIKWPNDIYYGDKKLVGILIENSLSGSMVDYTIAGIGINVNQSQFDASLPNPVSMAQLLNQKLDTEEVLQRYLDHLQRNYATLRDGNVEALDRRYNALLYRLDEPHTFALPSGERFTATIRGTRPSGALRLEHTDKGEKEYLFKEVEFVIF